jgi:hypothetical protein
MRSMDAALLQVDRLKPRNQRAIGIEQLEM